MMKSTWDKIVSTFFLIFISLQTLISLIQIMADPSEEKNVFLFGYSFPRLLMAAFFLIVLLFCFVLFIPNHQQKETFQGLVSRIIDHPKNTLLVFVSLLFVISISVILIAILHDINTAYTTPHFPILSAESLILHAVPIMFRFKLYLEKLIPFLKWCLGFGINGTLYLFYAYTQNNRASNGSQPNHNQQKLLISLCVILCLLLTALIYYPSTQSLVLKIDTLYDWLLIFTLIAGIGMLITIVNYSKHSLQSLIWGLLIIGIIFNLIDHTYNPSRLELSRQSANSLESFLVPSNPHYHFREYPVYQKLSQDYTGKELIISENLLEDLSLSTTRLIAFGRLSRVTLTQDNTAVGNEATNQLLKLPYSDMIILDRYRTETYKWIFIEEGLVDADKIYIKTTPQNDILVYPAMENFFLESSIQ